MTLPISDHIKRGMIRVSSGRMVAPFDLQPDDVTAVDCLHATSILNRYTGHTIGPYSVLEHSMLLTEFVPDRLKQAAFIHDWSEAYFNDLASPVKHSFTDYKAHEREAQKAIFDHMSVDFDLMEEVDYYDKRICADEMLVLFNPPYKHALEPLGINIRYGIYSRWNNARMHGWVKLCALFPQYKPEDYPWKR